MTALFSQETVNFLTENRLRNDKTWFEAHREQYHQYVIAPLVSLTEALTPALLEIDGRLIISPKSGGSVSRIWRDARFSKDKSLFRDSMWCSFLREKNGGWPEFFFVISPEGFLYGCGYYSAGAASMESMRELITSGDNSFRAALASYEGQKLFRLDGEKYKKSRWPDQPENLREWLDRKSICFLREDRDFDLLYSERLSGAVAGGFRALAPVYDFMIRAEERIR